MATKNFWNDRFHFYCDNGHTITEDDGKLVKDPIEFTEQSGKSYFYACPKYFQVDEAHPLGFYADEEHQCLNNLGFNDAEKIVTHLEKKYEEQIESGIICDLTNYSFKVGQIDVNVLLHDTDDHLHLGIINHKAINR